MDMVQATTVSIKIRNFSLAVRAAYSFPRHNLKKEHYLDFLKSLEEKFIAKDLNPLMSKASDNQEKRVVVGYART